MSQTRDGRFIFHDWKDILEAIEYAKQLTGELKPGETLRNVPTPEWNLIGTAIAHYHEKIKQRNCFNCTDPIDLGKEIRCLDCRMVFCPDCAHKHFWPNGRPKAEESH